MSKKPEILYKIIERDDSYELRSYVDAKFFTTDVVCDNFVCEGSYEYCEGVLNKLKEGESK